MFPKTIQAKNGQTFTIRKAQVEDAAAMLAYTHLVGAETDFLTFGEGEFDIDFEQEVAFIKQNLASPNQICLLSIYNDEVVSMLNLSAHSRPRIRHFGEFGISVLKEHWGIGIGKAMIEAMLEWAKATNILTKINLNVDTENVAALKLYEKLGFEYEGRIKNEVFLNGEYRDSYCMGKLL